MVLRHPREAGHETRAYTHFQITSLPRMLQSHGSAMSVLAPSIIAQGGRCRRTQASARSPMPSTGMLMWERVVGLSYRRQQEGTQVAALHACACPYLAPSSLSISDNASSYSIYLCCHLFRMAFSFSRRSVLRTLRHRFSPAVILLPSRASSGHVSDSRYAEQALCVYPKGWQQPDRTSASILWQGRKCLGICLSLGIFCGPLVQR